MPEPWLGRHHGIHGHLAQNHDKFNEISGHHGMDALIPNFNTKNRQRPLNIGRVATKYVHSNVSPVIKIEISFENKSVLLDL